MNEELRARRDETFGRLIESDESYMSVVENMAREWDVTEQAIKDDISKMDEWIPKLAAFDDDGGQGRLLELQRNRQRMHQLAEETDDPLEELRIRREIAKAIETEVTVAQSIGELDQEPRTHEIKNSGDLLADFTGEDTDT